MFHFTAPFSQGDCDSLFHYEARRFGGRRHQFRKYTIVGGTVMFNSWHVQCDIELVGRTYSLLNNDFSCVRILSSDLFCLPRVYFFTFGVMSLKCLQNFSIGIVCTSHQNKWNKILLQNYTPSHWCPQVSRDWINLNGPGRLILMLRPQIYTVSQK